MDPDPLGAAAKVVRMSGVTWRPPQPAVGSWPDLSLERPIPFPMDMDTADPEMIRGAEKGLSTTRSSETTQKS